MRVVHTVIEDPKTIFNLTSPRYLPEVSMRWNAHRPWWDARYNAVRDLMERLYVDLFNQKTGHFDFIERDILANGILNPVMLSRGFLKQRSADEIPPQLRGRSDLLVSEYLGGSRIWVAQKHNLPVPAIVSDANDDLVGAVLSTAADVDSYFANRPAHTSFLHDGSVTLAGLPYTHIPEAQRYTQRHQSDVRREVVHQIRVEIQQWLMKND